MSTARKLPNSNISRKKAMNALVKKNNSVVAPLTSALTAATITRLNIDNTNFNAAYAAVTAAKAARIKARDAAVTSRVSLHDYIGVYFKTMNSNIVLDTMPNTARSYYGLSISNKKLPLVDTDERLLFWSNEILTGDAARVLAGGVAMANPTIAEFTAIFVATDIVLETLSTAKTALSTAQTALNGLRTEADSLILQGWNEVETTFSGLEASAKRTAAREWGVKYISIGLPAVVTGIITDSVTGLPLAKVKVHIGGSNTKVLTDEFGRYSINTNLYGDLELITTLKDYDEGITDFSMANGVDMTVDAVMEAE